MAKSKIRTKSTGEIFTPLELVDLIIDRLYDTTPSLFKRKNKIFLDPACGDGEFLRGVIRKLKRVLGKGFTRQRWEHAIHYQLLGVDIMWDNVCDTIYFLLRSWEWPLSNEKIEVEIVTTFMSNFELTENSEPGEINEAFLGRSYKDLFGTIDIRSIKDSKHYVEYSVDGGKWVPVENIVRANSLTEWDFENWCPK